MGKEERKSLLAEAWDAYFERMFSLSYLLTLNEDAAEGIVVDAYLALYRKLEKDIQGDNNIKAFLYTTVRNKSLQFCKSHV